MGYRAIYMENCAAEAEPEDGWYLLRKSLRVRGRAYRAGSVVKQVGSALYIEDVEQGFSDPLPLDRSMVCGAWYDGVALFEVECAIDGVICARPVSGCGPFERIDPMVVIGSIEPGESRVFARFGRCFLPLEFFGW